jgi:hypothetical protein
MLFTFLGAPSSSKERVRSVTSVTTFQEDVIVWSRANSLVAGNDERNRQVVRATRTPRNVISGLRRLDYARRRPMALGVVVTGVISRNNLQ